MVTDELWDSLRVSLNVSLVFNCYISLRYAMVFDDDSKEGLNKKKKEKKKVESSKKKYDSQSEDEGDQKDRKRTSKLKKGRY